MTLALEVTIQIPESVNLESYTACITEANDVGSVLVPSDRPSPGLGRRLVIFRFDISLGRPIPESSRVILVRDGKGKIKYGQVPLTPTTLFFDQMHAFRIKDCSPEISEKIISVLSTRHGANDSSHRGQGNLDGVPSVSPEVKKNENRSSSDVFSEKSLQPILDELKSIKQQIESIESRVPQAAEMSQLTRQLSALQQQMGREDMKELISSVNSRLTTLETQMSQQSEVISTLQRTLSPLQNISTDLGRVQEQMKGIEQLDSTMEQKLRTILDEKIPADLDAKISAFERFEPAMGENFQNTIIDRILHALDFETFKRDVKTELKTTLGQQATDSTRQVLDWCGAIFQKVADSMVASIKEIEENHPIRQFIEDIEPVFRCFGEILKEASAALSNASNAYLREVEASERQKQLSGIQQKAGEIRDRFTAIIDKGVGEFGLDAGKFASFKSNLEQILAELENTHKRLEPPVPVNIISFKECLEKWGQDWSLAEVHDDLNLIRQQYADYFKQFDTLKQAAANSATVDVLVADKLETFVTNGIVQFANLLDEELRKNGQILPVSPIEDALQELFEVSGLEEIKVIEGKNKYNATLHEAVRWVTDGDLPRDTIVKLVRRGFIYNQEVLREARVHVRQ